MNTGGEVVALIKPQFEAGREKVGKKGVVRDPKVHEEVIEKICDFASTNGFDYYTLIILQSKVQREISSIYYI